MTVRLAVAHVDHVRPYFVAAVRMPHAPGFDWRGIGHELRADGYDKVKGFGHFQLSQPSCLTWRGRTENEAVRGLHDLWRQCLRLIRVEP